MLKLHRGNLRTLLIIFCLLFMSYNTRLFNSGAIVFFCGLFLHFISKGFLHRNEELAVNGPYSFFRHPFYMANLLLDSGIILMSGHPLIMIIYVPLYYKSYHRVILREESGLLEAYGDLYRNYMKAVPRYRPRRKPYAGNWSFGFKWSNIMRERELSRLLRLTTYPFAFLILREAVNYKMTPPRNIIVLLGIGFCGLLLFTSYLVHNLLERERIFRKENAVVVNAIYFISLIFIFIVTAVVRYGKIEANPLIIVLTLLFLILGTLLISAEKYRKYLLGDSCFIIALCVYSGLLWLIPIALLAVVLAVIYNLKREVGAKALLLPAKTRVIIYISLLILFILSALVA